MPLLLESTVMLVECVLLLEGVLAMNTGVLLLRVAFIACTYHCG